MSARGCCGGTRRRSTNRVRAAAKSTSSTAARSTATAPAATTAAAGSTGYGVEISEAVFQIRVTEAAKWHHWMVVHYRPCLRQSGKRSTPVQGDKGGPDLLLARDGVVLLVELKTDKGRLSPDQRRWREHIDPAVYRLWRPADWDQIELELAG